MKDSCKSLISYFYLLSLVSLLLFFILYIGLIPCLLYYKYNNLCVFSILGRLIPHLYSLYSIWYQRHGLKSILARFDIYSACSGSLLFVQHVVPPTIKPLLDHPLMFSPMLEMYVPWWEGVYWQSHII